MFTPGVWEGSGTITFSMADDELTFTMVWRVAPFENGGIHFSQQIHVDTFPEMLQNSFYVWQVQGNTFCIQLENSLVGKVVGKGVFDKSLIAWEFRDPTQAFEGYETYVVQPDGSYKMRGEFSSGEGLKTRVQGLIKKNALPFSI